MNNGEFLNQKVKDMNVTELAEAIKMKEETVEIEETPKKLIVKEVAGETCFLIGDLHVGFIGREDHGPNRSSLEIYSCSGWKIVDGKKDNCGDRTIKFERKN